MRQSSIIIHKGGKEDKYEIYVEDYVLSYLKEETGTLELSEYYFYGFKEKYGRKYTIYGAGRDKHIAVFDKYSLLEEIGCRLTQAGPVFWVREGTDTYEIKGYEIFYQDNKEMQTYLIDWKSRNKERRRNGETDRVRGTTLDERRKEQRIPQKTTSYYETPADRMTQSHTPYSAISVQLGVILIVLVAIVINSTNSYDKMQQLNQSASEVFFAMENQEAENAEKTGGSKDDIVVERDQSQGEDVLKLAAIENEEQASDAGEISDEETPQADEGETTAPQGNHEDDEEPEESEEPLQHASGEENEAQPGENEGDSEQAETGEDASEGKEEEVEALSRNVARYYKVERGDTLYTISQKIYGDTTHVQRICELNQITDPDRIRYGQKIILP